MTYQLPEPIAHMYPSDLERFSENETFATAFSVAVGKPGEISEPLFESAQMQAAYEAGLRIAPEGYKLVPIEPTPEMIAAAYNGRYSGGTEATYLNMLAAAPEPLK